jgi:ADP-heptose:LPS heptosyltransferase
VTGNRDMVLASLSSSQAHVAAGLACYLVAIAPKQDGQFPTTEVPWQPQAATTSSRTACKWIRSGCSSGSMWQ